MPFVTADCGGKCECNTTVVLPAPLLCSHCSAAIEKMRAFTLQTNNVSAVAFQMRSNYVFGNALEELPPRPNDELVLEQFVVFLMYVVGFVDLP